MASGILSAMKTLILASLILFPLVSQASEYTCHVGFIKFELKTNSDMTTLTIKDTQSGEFHYSGVVKEIIKDARLTDIMFETQPHSFMQLRFKTSELENESAKLFGLARGFTGRSFVDDSIQCAKNTNHLAL